MPFKVKVYLSVGYLAQYNVSLGGGQSSFALSGTGRG